MTSSLPQDPAAESQPNQPDRFDGFEPLDANFLYCPNQFFDVCLRHSSRGVVRLVAFMLDKTLGWLDSDGNPITEEITVSYKQLIEQARISRGAVRKAVDEAIAAGFIQRVAAGRACSGGRSAEQSSYTLRWNEAGDYATDPQTFEGFFAGTGHCTPIPNTFFRLIVPQESLAVVRLVGTVLRHTVGFESKYGGRRRQAALSYDFIQQYSGLRGRQHISAAIQHGIAANYIMRLHKGTFDSDPNKRTASMYAPRWVSDAKITTCGSKSLPVNSAEDSSTQAVQKGNQTPFKKVTSSGSKRLPENRFKKVPVEKTNRKDTLKQQRSAAVAEENQAGYELLKKEGIDHLTASRLAAQASHEQIQQQISWLPDRNARQNPVGMLIRSIEERWTEPSASLLKRRQQEAREKDAAQQKREQRDDQQRSLAKQQRIQRATELRRVYDSLSEEEQQQLESAAFERQTGDSTKRMFRLNESHRLRECLKELDRQSSIV